MKPAGLEPQFKWGKEWVGYKVIQIESRSPIRDETDPEAWHIARPDELAFQFWHHQKQPIPLPVVHFS